MSLKAKLTSLVLGIIFAMSMMMVGVLSATQVNLGIGGNVTFTAKGINCTISEGYLTEGAANTPVTKATGSMLGFTYSTTTAVDTGKETTFKNSWTGLNLNVNENGDTLRINFTIKNNSERNSNDCIKVTIDPTSSQGTLSNMKEIEYICPELITPQSTKSYSIIFQVDNKEVNASITGFDIKIKLEYQEVAPVESVDGLTFAKIADGKASVKATSPSALTGAVVIPNRVKLNGEILDVTKIADAESVDTDTVEASGSFTCMGITSLTLPETLEEIGMGSFAICFQLATVNISDGVTSIGDYAFYDCTSLTSIEIPSSVTSIGAEAFSGCSELTSITISSSVTSIGVGVFFGCSFINITIPSSVTSIGAYAFSGCSSLTSITIPSSVTRIGDRAFYDCFGLTNITIPNSVTSIGAYAFSDCSSLTGVAFENPTGWKYSDLANATTWTDLPNKVNLSDSAQAATALRETYCNKYWKRG